MDKFIAEGILPGFKRLFDEAYIFKTDAGESPPALEPWIQWVTVHTGKAYAQHKVFELSDGHLYRGDRVWDIVSDSGGSVWVCGSMNSAIRDGKINGLILPDPWAVGIDPFPVTAFRDYFRFVSTYVKEYSAKNIPLSVLEYVRFGWFVLSHGLSLRTIWQLLVQLLTEGKGNKKWAMAFVLDNIQFDLFRYFYKKFNPVFSTIFLNSTAHLQHFYWRNMEPDLFDIQPSAQDQVRYHDAIRRGYMQMDGLVCRTLDMAGADTTIVFATALSQQPLVKHDLDGGKLLFKPYDNAKLIRLAGIVTTPRQDQVMSNQFYLVFDTEEEARDAAERLSSIMTSEGEMLLDVRLIDEKISVVCNIYRLLENDVTVTSPHCQDVLLFNNLFYPIHDMRSGYHHPEGMFWVRTRQHHHAVIERKISLQEIAPTLLRLCGVEAVEGVFDFPAIAELEIGAEKRHEFKHTPAAS